MAYDSADTARLEQALASSLPEVKVCGGKYGVDLRTLKQRNLVTGFMRNVRRTENTPQSGQKKVALFKSGYAICVIPNECRYLQRDDSLVQ